MLGFPLLPDGNPLRRQIRAGRKSVDPGAQGGRRGRIGDGFIEPGDARDFSVGFDGEFDRAALQIVVLRVESSSRGIVGVSFRRGAGFFVGGAQACGAGSAARCGLHANDVEANLQIRNLFQLRSRFGIGDRRGGGAGCRGSRFDVIAERFAHGEIRRQVNARRGGVADDCEQQREHQSRNRCQATRPRSQIALLQFLCSVVSCSLARGDGGFTGWIFGERTGPVRLKSCAAMAAGRGALLALAAGITRSWRLRLREKSTEPETATSCAAPLKRSRWNVTFPLPHAKTAVAAGNELVPGRGSASRKDSSKLIFCSLASVICALPRHSSEETRSARVAPLDSTTNSPEAEPANRSASVGNSEVSAASSTPE